MKRSSHPQTEGSLLRVLGVVFGLSVTIGGTIGMGILRTPGEVAKQLPTPSLFIGIWIVGGVYALLGAVSVAELGAMIPRSGGFYVFATARSEITPALSSAGAIGCRPARPSR